MKRLFLTFLALVLSPSPALTQGDVWSLVSSTTGASVSAILPDSKAPDTLYVGTTTGVSKVSASTRSTIGSQISIQNISDLAPHPLGPDTLYAGSSATGGGISGVYRTTDRGASWSRLATQPPNTTIFSIAVDPKSPGSIYVGTFLGGVFKGANGGTIWSDFNDSTLNSVSVSDIAIRPTGPDTVFYAATPGFGVFKRVGGAGRWTATNTGLSANAVNVLQIDPTAPNVLYAGLTNGVYKSTDGGATWTKKSAGMPDGSDVRALVLAPSRPSVLYAGTLSGGVYRSATGAEAWDAITNNLPTAPVQALAVSPLNPLQVYAGTSSGLYLTVLKSMPRQTSWEVGRGPAAVAVANLDTSALPDLAVANSADNTVSVLLNRGGGLFLRKDIPVGGGPRSIAAADVDGDGKRDLLAGNRIGQSVTILRNNGLGGFTFFLDLFVSHAVESVAAVDLNGDGAVDLVTANGDANTISIFLNGGRGTFLPPQEQAVGAGPRSVVAADFNGDGRPDLAVADQAGDAVSILINRGGGLFQPDAPISVPGGPTSVAVGDFNLDGVNDVAVAAGGRNVLALLYGNGNGTFRSPDLSQFGEAPVSLSVGDLDADRYPDLAVAFAPGGTVASLLNDGSGKFSMGPPFGSVSGVGGVVAADLDSDGRPDVAALSSDAGAVVLFRNLLPPSVRRPLSPRNLKASDTPADLGGRITLTWQQPRADEETGRAVTYEVFRSEAQNGAYRRIAAVDVSAPFVSRDTTLVTRIAVDSTATVGVPFFYYVTAKDASGMASAPSAVVTATSIAQPFFNFDFSNLSLYSVGDTITVRVSLNPLSYRLSGLSLFLDYHPRALTLLDADPAKAGVQPFAINPALLSGGVQMLENRLGGDAPGKINLSVGALSQGQNLSFDVGTLRFATPRDTVATLAISNDAAGNRRTVLINAADGSAFSPNLPPQPATILVRNYRVNGSVRFQGRSSNLDLPVQIDLRQSNGLPLPTPYSPPNDQDKNRDGVQLLLDKSGGFSLIQVPAGRYAVFVKEFHYLRGRVTGDSVTVGPGSLSGALTFRWVSSVGTAFNELRGGDANNDNNVNLVDFGLLAKYFGTFGVVDAQNPAWVADFNSDGLVNLADFSVFSSNFGEQGSGQSFSTKPVPPAARLNVVRSRDSESFGGIESFRVFVEGTPQVSGFSADLVYDPADFTLSDSPLSEGDATRAQGVDMWWIARPLSRGLRVAGYVKGDRPIQTDGGGEVALLRLQRRRGDALPGLQNVWVADGRGEMLPAVADAADAPPQQPALFQNVPNPFNPATTISYDVPDAKSDVRVTLRVYNLTGQVVRTLVDAPHAPGRYRAVWDSRDYLGRPVASGVYFYQLDVGAFRDVKRMLLLR